MEAAKHIDTFPHNKGTEWDTPEDPIKVHEQKNHP